LDGRNEQWDVERIPTFGLRTLEAGLELASLAGDRWAWRSGLSVSGRSFPRAPAAVSEVGELFAPGLALRYDLAAEHLILDRPAAGWEVRTLAQARMGKVLSGSHNAYGRLEAGLAWSWRPPSDRNPYRVFGRLRAGKGLGRLPLDELFRLGVDRDNDLYLRGHRGTKDGRKGSGPLGQDFLLANVEMDRLVYRHAFWSVSAGPFLDIGKASSVNETLGSGGWHWDAGLQAKIRLPAGLTLVVSYGNDLGSGESLVHTTVLR
jgi:hypothetical protein